MNKKIRFWFWYILITIVFVYILIEFINLFIVLKNSGLSPKQQVDVIGSLILKLVVCIIGYFAGRNYYDKRKRDN